MTPPPVTEADRKRWIADAVADYASAWDLTIEQQNDLTGTMEKVAAALLSSQREEDCRAVCGFCAAGRAVEDRRPGYWWHPGRDGQQGEFCAASPIRSLSLPAPRVPCAKCGATSRGVCSCLPAPPKPEPR